MIFCKYCGGKNEKQYLYLACKHLSCLACAFLRTEFTTQEIECCDKKTRIDENSMEMIIKSKRYMRGFEENQEVKFSYIGLLQENSNIQGAESQAQGKQREREKVAASEFIYGNPNTNTNEESENKVEEKKESSEIKKTVAEYRKEICEEDQYELQNILVRHLEKSKSYFEAERQALKERESQAIKNLISIFENERKTIERPITQAVLQKFNLNLQKKSSSLTPESQSQSQPQSQLQQNTQSPSQQKPLKESRESYDHILKRLQINQQRMKQKIQKHLQVLY